MNQNKTAGLVGIAIGLTLLVVVGCDKPPTVPAKPTGPDTTWTGVNTTYTTVATASGEIQYVFDWGDGKIDTSGAVESGTQYGGRHVWNVAGTYQIKAMALLAKNTAKASDWSEAKSVVVIQNDAPIIESIWTLESRYTSKEAELPVRAWARDPNGDSLRIYVQWKSNKTDSSATWLPSPGTDSLTYAYTDTGTVWIKVYAKDKKGAVSNPESVSVRIGEAGGVIWYWWNADGWPLVTTPVLYFDGTDTVVGASCEDDFYFYTLKVNSRRFADRAGRIQTKYVSTEESWFSGHAAYLESYGHIIIGSDEGELYFLKGAGPSRKWNWPDSGVNSLTYDEFGPACISGNKIYVGREESTGAIYYFLDRGDNESPVVAGGPYYLGSSVVDAPIVDNTGNVYFGTDSGYLYKMNDLINTVIWRLQFPGAREVYGPILGNDGTIYCANDARRIYSINPTTNPPTVNWSYTLDGTGTRPVLGQYLFIGTDIGTLYALTTSGSLVWRRTLTDAISTAPIIVTGGLLYVQTDDDKLHCIRQDNGVVEWTCDCAAVLPSSAPRARRLSNADITPSPTITGRGNIIVLGEQATYCVKGYPDKLLDANAAWPKWMKNVYNTGK